MNTSITVTVANMKFTGELNDSVTAGEIRSRLPIEVRTSAWGDELYGSLPFQPNTNGDDSKEIMAIGELAYWPPGNAVCLFYGPTPASLDGEPRIASPGFSLGHIDLPDEGRELHGISGATIRIEES